MSHRGGLIVLQAIGGLSIVPYPFVLLANIMSIAAEGQTLLGAIPYILLSIYPVVWIGLYVLAWRMLATGATGMAFALSSIPVLLCLCGAGLFFHSERSVKTHYSKAAEEKRGRWSLSIRCCGRSCARAVRTGFPEGRKLRQHRRFRRSTRIQGW
jgi:hypothetical protein